VDSKIFLGGLRISPSFSALINEDRRNKAGNGPAVGAGF
jgi:hypothetical protein